MSNTKQQSKSWMADPKEVKKGYLGLAIAAVALAPLTGGTSIIYGLGHAAFLGLGSAIEQDKK